MAGHSSGWVKVPGKVKGKVFVSNTAIAATYNLALADKAGIAKAKAKLQQMADTTVGSSTATVSAFASLITDLAAKSPQPGGKVATTEQAVTAKELAQVIDRLRKAQRAARDGNSSDLEAAEQDFRAIFRRAQKGVEPDDAERRAMEFYQGSGYNTINADLWGRVRTRDKKIDIGGGLNANKIAALMRASKKYATPAPMTTYRAINADHPLHQWAKEIEPGAVYVNKGFDSSSLNPTMDPVKGAGEAATRMIFRVPKGAKGIYFNGTPGYDKGGALSGEMEWLVPSNSTWLVSAKRVRNGVTEVVVDLLDQRDLDGSVIWP